MPDYYEELENELTKAEADLELVAEERDALWAQRTRLMLQKARLLDALEKMRAHGHERLRERPWLRGIFQNHQEKVRIAGLATQHVQELAFQRDSLDRERRDVLQALGFDPWTADPVRLAPVVERLVAERDELAKGRQLYLEQRDEAEQRIRDLTMERDRFARALRRDAGPATRTLLADWKHERTEIAQALGLLPHGPWPAPLPDTVRRVATEREELHSSCAHLEDRVTYMADRLKAIRQALGGYSDSDLVSLVNTMQARLAHLEAIANYDPEDPRAKALEAILARCEKVEDGNGHGR